MRSLHPRSLQSPGGQQLAGRAHGDHGSAGPCLLFAASWDAPLQLSLLPVIQRVLAAHLAVCLRCSEPAPRSQPSAFRLLGLAAGRAVCSHHERSALGVCTSLLTTWIWLFNQPRSQPGKTAEADPRSSCGDNFQLGCLLLWVPGTLSCTSASPGAPWALEPAAATPLRAPRKCGKSGKKAAAIPQLLTLCRAPVLWGSERTLRCPGKQCKSP